MKFPTFSQWLCLPRILTRRETAGLLLCLAGMLSAGCFILYSEYISHTKVIPADKGSFSEGMVGAPRFLNPLYADSNDVDRDISEVLYSGLMAYDINGNLVPDLAKSYSLADDGTTYEFILKDNLKWSDGAPLTADDILYTISIIQDADYKSPLRGAWLGVTGQKITNTSLRLKLKNPYSSFLETCVLKILPKHIWSNISASDFPLSPYNLQPISNGPYIVKSVNRDKNNNITSLTLAPNEYYYGQKPHLQNIIFSFYNNKESLIAAFNRGAIQAFAPQEMDSQNNTAIAGTRDYSFLLPRYFALFFNSNKNAALTDKYVRQALNYAVNKTEIIQQVLNGKGTVVNSPILPDYFDLNNPTINYNYDIKQAADLLDKEDFKISDNGIRIKSVNKKPAFTFTKNLMKGSKLDPDVKELQQCLRKEVAPNLQISGNFGADTLDAVNKFQEKYRDDILEPNGLNAPTGDVKQATRDKLNQVCFPAGNQTIPLHFTITTVNQPIMVATANLIKTQWQAIGAAVDIKIEDIDSLENNVIKPRDYEILLFGEMLGMRPDPFPYWSSTQINDPGLNLALFQNTDADKLLNNARQAIDDSIRNDNLENFQNLLLDNAPAVFLYNPDYIYTVSDKIQGIKGGKIAAPPQRFGTVNEWYTQVKRVWK